MKRYLSTVASLFFLGLINRPELRAAAPLRQLQQATLLWVLEFKKRKMQDRSLVLVGDEDTHACAFPFYVQLPLEFLLYRAHETSSPHSWFSFSRLLFFLW